VRIIAGSTRQSKVLKIPVFWLEDFDRELQKSGVKKSTDREKATGVTLKAACEALDYALSCICGDLAQMTHTDCF
jgi:hypothetical protein